MRLGASPEIFIKHQCLRPANARRGEPRADGDIQSRRTTPPFPGALGLREPEAFGWGSNLRTL